MAEGPVAEDARSVDEQRAPVVGAGAEDVASRRRDLQQAGIGGQGIGTRTRNDDRTSTESAIGKAGRQDTGRRVADASAAGSDGRRWSRGKHREVRREAARGVAESGDIRRERDDRVLHAHRIRPAQHDRVGGQGRAGRGIDQVREDQGAEADVHRLVSRVTEDDRRGARGDVELGSRAVGGVAGQVQDAQDVTVGRGDIERLASVEQQLVELDGVPRVRSVVADADVGEAQRTADGDLAGVGDDAVAARAAVKQRQHAVVADRRGGAGINRGRGAGIETGKGQRAGIHGHATGEGVVAAEEERAQTLLRERVAAAGFADDAVQGQRDHRLVDGDGRVADKRRRGVQRQRVRAGERQRGADRIGVIDRVGRGSKQARAAGHRQGARTDRSGNEGRRLGRGSVPRRDVGAGTNDEAARTHGHAAREGILRAQLQEAVTRLGQPFGACSGHDGRDVQLREVRIQDGAVPLDVIDGESAGRAAQAEDAARSEANEGGGGRSARIPSEHDSVRVGDRTDGGVHVAADDRHARRKARRARDIQGSRARISAARTQGTAQDGSGSDIPP